MGSPALPPLEASPVADLSPVAGSAALAENPGAAAANPLANTSTSSCKDFCEQQVPSKIMGGSVFISVIGVAGAIVWGSGNSYLLAGAFAINALASALGWFGWRRFYTLRNLDQVTGAIETVGAELEEVSIRTGDAARGVLDASNILSEENQGLKVRLAGVEEELEKNRQRLGELQKALDEKNKSEGQLHQINEGLQKKVESLQACLEEWKARLLEFQEQNKSFAEDLQKMGIHIDSLDVKKLEEGVDEADKIWDENTGNLQSLAESIQAGARALFEGFKQQNVVLQEQLDRLKGAGAKAEALQKQIADRVKELQDIEENIERERKELAALSLQYQKIQEQFVQTSKTLDEKTRELKELQARSGQQDQRLLVRLTEAVDSLRRENEDDQKDDADFAELRKKIEEFCQ